MAHVLPKVYSNPSIVITQEKQFVGLLWQPTPLYMKFGFTRIKLQIVSNKYTIIYKTANTYKIIYKNMYIQLKIFFLIGF